jgi:hypothetical protein
MNKITRNIFISIYTYVTFHQTFACNIFNTQILNKISQIHQILLHTHTLITPKNNFSTYDP